MYYGYCVCLSTVRPREKKKRKSFFYKKGGLSGIRRKKKKFFFTKGAFLKTPGMWSEPIGHLPVRGRSLTPASLFVHGPATSVVCCLVIVTYLDYPNIVFYIT